MTAGDAARGEPGPAVAPAGRGPGVGAPPEQWPTGRLLSTAARRVERAWDAYLARWGLSHSSLPVLAVLAGGPRSQRDLARALDVTEQTVSRMLLRLEAAGYVERQRHVTDRRRQVVALTPAGSDALHDLDDRPAVEAMISERLDVGQVAELRTLLLALVGPDDRPGPSPSGARTDRPG